MNMVICYAMKKKEYSSCLAYNLWLHLVHHNSVWCSIQRGNKKMWITEPHNSKLKQKKHHSSSTHTAQPYWITYFSMFLKFSSFVKTSVTKKKERMATIYTLSIGSGLWFFESSPLTLTVYPILDTCLLTNPQLVRGGGEVREKKRERERDKMLQYSKCLYLHKWKKNYRK